ncbi:MAG: rRNA maturation RNase YbeY [Xanthobacteraceae bacterium]
MTRAARPTLTIDILIASDHWKDPEKLEPVVRRAVTRAAALLSTKAAELAIVLTDDSAIRALNRDWRGIDKATNVLSFPTKNVPARLAAKHLGDIVLAFETIAREARSERKALPHHLAHLAVHGFLHLVGYDHEQPKDALKMEHTERRILRDLGIADPYLPGPRAAAIAGPKKPAKRRRKS